LTGARLDAQLAFPAPLKQLLTDWRADFTAVSIDDTPVFVVQGTTEHSAGQAVFRQSVRAARAADAIRSDGGRHRGDARDVF
jgi:hypothetical protein